MMGDHLAISGGLLQAPLNPPKTDVLRGCQVFQVGQAPSGPHRNSTTVCLEHHYCGDQQWLSLT